MPRCVTHTSAALRPPELVPAKHGHHIKAGGLLHAHLGRNSKYVTDRKGTEMEEEQTPKSLRSS